MPATQPAASPPQEMPFEETDEEIAPEVDLDHDNCDRLDSQWREEIQAISNGLNLSAAQEWQDQSMEVVVDEILLAQSNKNGKNAEYDGALLGDLHDLGEKSRQSVIPNKYSWEYIANESMSGFDQESTLNLVCSDDAATSLLVDVTNCGTPEDETKYAVHFLPGHLLSCKRTHTSYSSCRRYQLPQLKDIAKRLRWIESTALFNDSILNQLLEKWMSQMWHLFNPDIVMALLETALNPLAHVVPSRPPEPEKLRDLGPHSNEDRVMDIDDEIDTFSDSERTKPDENTPRHSSQLTYYESEEMRDLAFLLSSHHQISKGVPLLDMPLTSTKHTQKHVISSSEHTKSAEKEQQAEEHGIFPVPAISSFLLHTTEDIEFSEYISSVSVTALVKDRVGNEKHGYMHCNDIEDKEDAQPRDIVARLVRYETESFVVPCNEKAEAYIGKSIVNTAVRQQEDTLPVELERPLCKAAHHKKEGDPLVLSKPPLRRCNDVTVQEVEALFSRERQFDKSLEMVAQESFNLASTKFIKPPIMQVYHASKEKYCDIPTLHAFLTSSKQRFGKLNTKTIELVDLIWNPLAYLSSEITPCLQEVWTEGVEVDEETVDWFEAVWEESELYDDLEAIIIGWPVDDIMVDEMIDTRLIWASRHPPRRLDPSLVLPTRGEYEELIKPKEEPEDFNIEVKDEPITPLRGMKPIQVKEYGGLIVSVYSGPSSSGYKRPISPIFDEDERRATENEVKQEYVLVEGDTRNNEEEGRASVPPVQRMSPHRRAEKDMPPKPKRQKKKRKIDERRPLDVAKEFSTGNRLDEFLRLRGRAVETKHVERNATLLSDTKHKSQDRQAVAIPTQVTTTNLSTPKPALPAPILSFDANASSPHVYVVSSLLFRHRRSLVRNLTQSFKVETIERDFEYFVGAPRDVDVSIDERNAVLLFDLIRLGQHADAFSELEMLVMHALFKYEHIWIILEAPKMQTYPWTPPVSEGLSRLLGRLTLIQAQLAHENVQITTLCSRNDHETSRLIRYAGDMAQLLMNTQAWPSTAAYLQKHQYFNIFSFSLSRPSTASRNPQPSRLIENSSTYYNESIQERAICSTGYINPWQSQIIFHACKSIQEFWQLDLSEMKERLGLWISNRSLEMLYYQIRQPLGHA